MLPVLLVCFSRPTNLLNLLNSPELFGREVYIFVDKASELSTFKHLNQQVIAIANYYESLKKAQVKISEINLGVEQAVPFATNWALSLNNSVIILEDDCIPKPGALKYFDENINLVSGKIVMISGYGLQNEISPYNSKYQYRLTRFPMIWGWATTRTSWELLVSILVNPPMFKKTVFAIFKNPNHIVEICFFYAAFIRVKCNRLQAWDAPIALEMLVSNYKCALSILNLIENIGDDAVASHKMNFKRDVGLNDGQDIDVYIKKKIYKMRIWHILSPLKSMLGFYSVQYPIRKKL